MSADEREPQSEDGFARLADLDALDALTLIARDVHLFDGREDARLSGPHARRIARQVLAWLAARRPAPVEVVSSVEELDALPVGTLIEVGYTQPDGHVVTTQVLRIEHGDGGAASGGASLRGGRFWTQVWGWADSIRVLFRPDREEKN